MMKLLGTRKLETKRLILRRFVIEDAEDMYNNWASDSEVTKYLTWPTHPSSEVSKMILREWISRYRDDNYFNWAIEYKETGKVIGSISVVNYSYFGKDLQAEKASVIL